MTWADYGIELEDSWSGEVRVTCPQCSEHRKKSHIRCMSVHIERGVWHCHHCGWHGALDKGQTHASRPNAWKDNVVRAIPLLPKDPLPQKVLDWFSRRGISPQTLERNHVAYGQGYIPQVQDWVPCLQFPFVRDGQIRNIKFRDSNKNFAMVAGAEILAFGYDDGMAAERVVWVEGEIDKFSLNEIGYDNVVSVPNGAPAPGSKSYSSKFDWLKAEDWAGKIHVLAVDKDAPGYTLQEELARRFGHENVFLVTWPEGVKDANECLQAYGDEELRGCIERAEPYPLRGLLAYDSTKTALYSLYERGFDRGLHPGWDVLAPHYTVRSGEWTVVTGMPGAGKSEWLDALLVNLSLQHGWRFGLYSPENYPAERHIAKLIEKYVGLPFHDGPFPRMQLEEMEQARQWVGEHFYWIYPEDDELTVEDILAKARALTARCGINGLVVDPWNELDHSRPDRLTETEYISYAISKIRRFARRYSLHVWLVAHPTKIHKEDGKYPPPTLYDISGSAHWRNKADNGITVHRDIAEGGQEVQIHVGKVRFKTTGKVGMVTLRYDKINGRYA